MHGKTAFISGGTSGINLGIAKQFARRGAAVCVFGRDLGKAESAAEELRAEGGGKVLAGAADVRDFEAVQALFADATAALGAPNIIIAGAAGNFMAPALRISSRGFKSVVDIDLIGTYHVFRAGFDVASKPGASFIAITAPQAVQPLPQQVHVCAAKAGVNMVVKVLAMEWGPLGVRVNAISPGPIQGTEGVERMAPTEAAKKMWTDRMALRQFGEAEDIASAAAFLCSDEARFITGAIMDCDGGMSLGDAGGDFSV